MSKLKRFRLIRDKLNRIVQVLELDFDYLFPQDYIDAIEQELLPWYKLPIIWIREIDISSLPAHHPDLLLPSSEEIFIDNTMDKLPETILDLLAELPKNESTILRLRYLDEMTLKEQEIIVALVRQELAK